MPDCPHGHPMEGDNVGTHPGARTRYCLTCDRAVPHRKRHDIGAAEDLPVLVLQLMRHILIDQTAH